MEGDGRPSPWGLRREAAPRPHRRCRRARGSLGRLRRPRLDHVPRRPARRRALARELAGPVRSGRGSLARERHRAVQRRARTSGAWGPWLDAAAEEEDQPDAGSREAAATRGWRVGNPTWVGPSNADPVPDHRAGCGSPGVVRPEPGAEDPAARRRLRRRAADRARAARGARTSRSARATPSYAPAIRFASVHHTAGPNNYSPAQAAAIMRGIEVYHVKSNGWNDIGYNFLVDRYGTVYEGRFGGIDRNVIGAYARGFNTGSIGVAVIGTFSTSAIPAAAETSLEKLLAWRLDLAHVDPDLDAHLRVGRQRALQGRCSRPPARRLRSPRHRADDLPRRPSLRAARRDRREDAGDRAAEALRARR